MPYLSEENDKELCKGRVLTIDTSGLFYYFLSTYTNAPGIQF